MQYADVIVDIASDRLDRIFQYRIPEHLNRVLRIGMQVTVPFGNGGRTIKGYVTGFSDTPDVEVSKIKEILDIPNEAVPAEGHLIALASWMAAHYGCTMIQALKTVLPVRRKIRAKVKRTIRLKADAETAQSQLARYRKKNQNARARLLEELLVRYEISYESAVNELKVTRSVMDALAEQNIITVEEEQDFRDPLRLIREKDKCFCGSTEQNGSVVYTDEQRYAIDTICADTDREHHSTFLLYGVTGSGKTEVYMGVIDKVAAEGGQAIVLIPEIALTYQTVTRFRRRYGSRVAIMNSRLSAGERYDQFCRCASGHVDVMIGPRSALFTPFPSLRLIVVDEEHESAYKSETVPRYSAVETAVYRGSSEGATVILGSATPSMESYYKSLHGEYTLLKLTDRIGGRGMASVRIVDMREELRNGNRSIISAKLDERIRANLAAGRQIMLFLNRRGYAGFISCRECGYVVKCSHCDVAMSMHRGGRMICHYCGSERVMPKICPECGSRHIGTFRAGTQQVEEIAHRLYPEARILRMDLDTTRDKNAHTQILSSFAAGEADILIGTQMIVKGHDFPGVTLVGILAADLSLYADDFRASERTFQLLTQAAGRSGRGGEHGEVVIQTYSPDHYAVELAAKQDYEAFYEREIVYREMMDYPPASHMMSVLLSGRDEELLEKAAGYLKQYGDTYCRDKKTVSFGPAAPSVAKVQDVYRKVVYYKNTSYDILIQIKDRLEEYRKVNSGFRKVNIQYDFI